MFLDCVFGGDDSRATVLFTHAELQTVVNMIAGLEEEPEDFHCDEVLFIEVITIVFLFYFFLRTFAICLFV